MRSTVWNQSIPDELRGRLGGIELLSYAVGPLGGQLRAGTMAALTTLRISIIGGGALCMAFVGFSAGLLRDFRNYDARTNSHLLEKKNSIKIEGSE